MSVIPVTPMRDSVQPITRAGVRARPRLDIVILMRPLRALALGTLVCAGCNQILGIGDVKKSDTPDAPPGTPDASVMTGDCPAPPADGIIGCANITHVHLDGSTTTSRQDLSAFTAAAYIVDSTQPGGFQIITGSTTADGVVTIPNVPAGASYYLRLQNPNDTNFPYPHYFFTDQRQLDLGHIEDGRDDTPTTSETDLTFGITGMTAWQPQRPGAVATGDAIELDSFSAGTTEYYFPNPPLAAGATTMNAPVDWHASGAGESTFNDFTDQYARVPQLLDGTQGDDLWVEHRRVAPVQDGVQAETLQTTVDAAQVDPGTMKNGMAATIAAPMQPAAAAAQMQSLSINYDAFRQAFRDGGHYATESVQCARSANPGAASGLVQGSLWTWTDPFVFGTPSSLSLNLSYTNPFPKAWPQMIHCEVGHSRVIAVPGSTKIASAYSYLYSWGPANDTFTWTPILHGVTNMMIGGKAAAPGGAIAFDGVKPVTVQWDALPGVNHYQLRFIGPVEGVVAVFDTSATSITIPADTFTKGNFYVFRVFAIQTPSDYTKGHLLRFSAPLWASRLASGLFRFSDLCGNGKVDPGEDCDPGAAGDTASCDADCSAVSCGDGYLNAAAGEQCDDMDESTNCNTNCKPVTCGDGIWNRTAEECDDGNTASGDGCSGLCKLEHCGDKVVQTPFEGCDDGNRLNGDGCSALCQPE
jgi:cysteine-rich repeat protein